MVRTPCFQRKGPGFDPWLGNYYLASHQVQPKEKKVSGGGETSKKAPPGYNMRTEGMIHGAGGECGPVFLLRGLWLRPHCLCYS